MQTITRNTAEELAERYFLDCRIHLDHDRSIGLIDEERWSEEIAGLAAAMRFWARACGADSYNDWHAGRIVRKPSVEALRKGRRALEGCTPEVRASRVLRLLEEVWDA